MAITLTERAVTRAKNHLAKYSPNAVLRLGVKPTGCSGNAYLVEFADAAGPDDQVFESDGVRIVVDRKSLAFLDGTEIDYAREGLNEGFRFKNPNEKARCGCGESFTV
ncbi:MAG TPA: iron-sulfur cluster assembly accessory protein [Burkholderiales bacterium]|jgi:iron-sulfur cluster assembly protein